MHTVCLSGDLCFLLQANRLRMCDEDPNVQRTQGAPSMHVCVPPFLLPSNFCLCCTTTVSKTDRELLWWFLCKGRKSGSSGLAKCVCKQGMICPYLCLFLASEKWDLSCLFHFLLQESASLCIMLPINFAWQKCICAGQPSQTFAVTLGYSGKAPLAGPYVYLQVVIRLCLLLGCLKVNFSHFALCCLTPIVLLLGSFVVHVGC